MATPAPNFAAIVSLSQLVAAGLTGHFGALGAIRIAITPRWIAGLCVMALGVYLARKPQ